MSAACPICRKPMDQQYKPFCSKRCADVDLGRWFGERYAVPLAEGPLDEAPPDESDGPEN